MNPQRMIEKNLRLERSRPWAVCDRIASEGGSTLWKASRSLSPERRRFFSAAYASMRVIDDRIDCEFLTLPPENRDAERGRVLGDLEDWRSRFTAAAEGSPAPGDEIAEAVRETVGKSDLGSRAWSLLARSLERDVREEPIGSWDDFLSYAEGAAVAPASVFVYLLESDPDAGGFQLRERISLMDAARNLAVFCYLVHILRDLVVDVTGSPQLVSVPRDLLRAEGLSFDRFRASLLEGEYGRVEPVLRFLADRARTFRAGAAADRERFRPRGSDVLAGFERTYDAVLAEACRRYGLAERRTR